MSKGFNEVQGIGRLALAMTTGGMSEVARAISPKELDLPTPVTSQATGLTVKEEIDSNTLTADSTRKTRRKKVSMGNKQFRVPLASSGVSTSGGSGLNSGGV